MVLVGNRFSFQGCPDVGVGLHRALGRVGLLLGAAGPGAHLDHLVQTLRVGAVVDQRLHVAFVDVLQIQFADVVQQAAPVVLVGSLRVVVRAGRGLLPRLGGKNFLTLYLGIGYNGSLLAVKSLDATRDRLGFIGQRFSRYASEVHAAQQVRCLFQLHIGTFSFVFLSVSRSSPQERSWR